MCGRFFISNRGKTEPSMPSTTLATNSPHTVPACSLSMWNQTNTTSSEGWNTALPRSSSRKGRRYRKASIAIFHLSNPYPSKCYKTTEQLFRLSPSASDNRICRGRICRKIKRKTCFPFAFCSLIRNFAAKIGYV